MDDLAAIVCNDYEDRLDMRNGLIKLIGLIVDKKLGEAK